MRSPTLLALVCLGATLAGPARAETPAQAPAQAPGGPKAVSVDPERLAAAREAVAQAQGDRAAVLGAMSAPMIGMVQQMGVKEPEKARVMVEEVIMPILAAHYDELLSIQALSYAAVLSTEDLKAVATFYASPAGRNLVKAQPQLTQALLTGMRQWVAALTGEMQDKLAKAAEANGWAGNGKPGTKPRAN